MTTSVDSQISSWYSMLSKGVPEITDPKFTSLAANSYGFDRWININKISTIVEKSEAAYADQEHNHVVLPLWYFSKDAIEKFEAGLPQHVALALINGSSIHEKLHFKHSPADLKVFCSHDSRTENLIKRYGKQNVYSMFNVLEDLYIEAQAYGPLEKWLDLKNEIFFTECPTEFKNNKLSQAIDVLVCAKNHSFRDDILSLLEDLNRKAYNDFNEIFAHKTDHSLRAHQFVDFILNFEPDEIEESESGEPSDAFGPTDPEAEAGKEAAATVEALDEDAKEGLEQIASEFGTKSEAKSKESDHKVPGTSIRVGPVQNVDVTDCRASHTHGSTPVINLSFSFLPNLLRLQTKNRVPGETRKTGTKMINTKVYRIATDGKMFANTNAEMDKVKKAEIIILGDASGSMGTGTGDGCSLFNHAVETSRLIHIALRKGMVSNSVYFHTSTSNNDPLLIHVSSFDMKKTNNDVEERFHLLEGIDIAENYDGFILEEVAKNFTKRENRKIIIVLSDGTPLGPGYRGDESLEHTKGVVAKLRKNGTSVICISLVRSVVDKNSEIYGKEFNVNGSSNLSKEFERTITQIQKSLR